MLIVLAVAAVVVGAWQLNRTTAATVTASAGPADGAAAGADRPPPPSPAPTVTPTDSSSPPATAATVDRSAAVAVLNGASRPGLAGRVAVVLRAAGWTVSTGNASQRQRTTVYFPGSEQRPAAEVLARDLGGDPVLEQSRRYGDRLTLVLGGDYTD